jgi:hypothetical protein
MRKSVSFMAALGGILACLFISQVHSQDEGIHVDAVRSVEEWLSLVDEQKYQETWEGLSDVFKRTITKEQWIADLESFRHPLGKPEKRKLLYVTESSDDDVGAYLIIQYQTSFENGGTKGEAVSVTRDDTGQRKILGYTVF